MLKCFSTSLTLFILFSFNSLSSTWYSVSSGNIQTDPMWSLTGIPPGVNASLLGGFSDTIDLVVQSGHIANLYNTGSVVVRTLEIQSGGRFWSTSTSNRYLTVYGNIRCDGIIGNGSIYNTISFNIESDSCAIFGSGVFDASRIRKNYDSNPVTEIHMLMDINLYFDTFSSTSFYNNSHGKKMNLVIYPGITLNLKGNGSQSNMSIDGTAGNSIFENSGSVIIGGHLLISGKLFMKTNNTILGNSCDFRLLSGGILSVDEVICDNSGLGRSSLTIDDGGVLNLNGVLPINGFSTINNVLELDTGSTVSYCGNLSQTIETEIF